MAKTRKMLGSAESPYILSLMRAIETQSRATIAAWSTDYAEEHLLPIYERAFPEDTRPRQGLEAARTYLAGGMKLAEAKAKIRPVQDAAREAEAMPAAQAAARAIFSSASAIHTPTYGLSLAFYGAAAIAYDRVGTEATDEVYETIAAEECAKMEAALRAVSVADEPNPAKIVWHC